MRRLFLIFSIIIFLIGLHLLYEGIALSNRTLASGVGITLLGFIEMEMPKKDVPATVLLLKEISISLIVASFVLFITSRIVGKKTKKIAK